jgi:hypothetical protein
MATAALCSESQSENSIFGQYRKAGCFANHTYFYQSQSDLTPASWEEVCELVHYRPRTSGTLSI